MSSDFFPNYTSQFITSSSGVRVYVRVSPDKGTKPPLLLLHGFPQTHVEFHKIAPLLVPHFHLILVDLRGYGKSSTIPDSVNGSAYSKRLMGADCLSVMDQLGYREQKFSILGHDRGARVAYRLAFDVPDRLHKVVVVDIIPTGAMFRGFGDISAGLRAYHWLFLAQPEPFPEGLISAADHGQLFLEHTLATWTAKSKLTDFDEKAMEEYRIAYCSTERIHATCEDYRAGAFLDRIYDDEELENERKIRIPLLAVWGEKGLFAESMKGSKQTPLDVWRNYASNVIGMGLQCGHFVPEEDPTGLVQTTVSFLSS